MANRVSFDVSDEYEASDSENEYTDREKQMLKKSRKSNEQNDSEEEILGFEESDEDNDKFEADSDFDEPQGDDVLPDDRAWGKTKQTFYNTDFNDQDYVNYTEREELQANQEQTEAREIQKRLANEFSEMDFNIDMISTKIPKMTQKKVAKSDLSDWTSKKKNATFSSEAPEFESLVKDFHNHLEESKQFLTPAADLFKSFDIHSHPIVQFVDLRNKLSLGYCTNISYYLLMKSRRITVQRHPLVRRLVQIRELIDQLDNIYDNDIKPKLLTLLSNNNASKDRTYKVLKNANVNKNEDLSDTDDLPKQLQFFDKPDIEDTVNLYKNDSSDNDENSKRKITRQIEKNKGLTAQKRKELRNPRVKNKIKFKKAVIRRKGAVQQVRSKVDLYGGEASGVKTHLKRSVKIK
ncbi:unnamed protein product [Diamesa serratosioi]